MRRNRAKVRSADAAEIERLAEIWFDGWQDAHAHILPAELARHRTLESFRERLDAALDDVRVVGAPGVPIGFSMIRHDELYQLYVSGPARGTGAADALNAEALERIGAHGYERAWLACAIGNDRAARFYEKSGWRRAGVVTSQLEIPGGVFELEVWRYEIPLPRERGR